ncbi:MAG: carbon-nitrogen hydrolase [Deltaproteobacteria bacterium HGW-Deltaproteobacteria-21]|jgi:predicted amidohydrolase|nr:MAG: carbon-nitrogen hydrolase [Deltaproteobacteria bacterium HGW-Deltaproteobacteria-21]
MKVGLIQFAPALAERDETIRRIDPLINRCKGADIVVLPELCNSGYNFPSPEIAWNGSEVIEESIFIRYLEDKCRDLGFHVVCGFCERDGGLLFNSAVLIGPNGVVGKYRKLHLFMNEKDYFQPGDMGLPIFDLGFCKIGMLVCFDWFFPEVWRILSLEGADIICHPSNLVLPGLAQKAIPVHALTNRIFVATCNRVGSEGDLHFTGLSLIADPKGEVLAEASQEGTDVLLREIDVNRARDKNITKRNHLFHDRRPREYISLVR